MSVETDIFKEAQRELAPAPPCVFVLFGSTGDLAARKIAPGLYNLHKDGMLGENIAVLGVARRDRSDEQFRHEMLEAISTHSRTKPVDKALWNQFAKRWYYHVVHADAPGDYQILQRKLSELVREHDTKGNVLFYLATTPGHFRTIAGNLGGSGLNCPETRDAFVRIVVEKPFGHDLESAKKLNEALLTYFEESQIYRIDHYLGKETVQNILVLRFANAIFEPIFTREHIDHVQITTAEDAGMESRRGPYYENAGALRDMVQNHLLQLLALTGMDPPGSMDPADIRNEKVKILRAIQPMSEQDVIRRTVRGQYAPGDRTRGYREEDGVASDSTVETYVALKLYIDNPRWRSVPFYLRTGKRLIRKTSQILVVFKREPIRMFTDPQCDLRQANRLAVRLYPDEGVNLVLDAKVPGLRMLLRPIRMDFRYGTSFESASPEAYEHLLLDAMHGDQTLFIRNDEVEASWEFVDNIRSVWESRARPELIQYTPGSWGPAEADGLFGDPYEKWQEI